MAQQPKNVPSQAHDVEAPASVAVPSTAGSVESGPGSVPTRLPTWSYKVFTIGGEVYESKVLDYKANGVEVRISSREYVFIPYFGMDRIVRTR